VFIILLPPGILLEAGVQDKPYHVPMAAPFEESNKIKTTKRQAYGF
jgi:hypothetical protein